VTLELDLEALRAELSPTEIMGDAQETGLRRFWRLLPVAGPQSLVTLGEGNTPLLRCERLERQIATGPLFAKVECVNPTGTFKDRCAALGVSRAKEIGAPAVAIASDGNAGPATAAYAAAAGLPCYVLMPHYATRERFAQTGAFTPNVFAIKGNINDCIDLVAQLSEANGWYHTTTAGPVDAFQAEGPKTIAYEICEQARFVTPDWVLAPVGGGGMLAALWRGFKEWQALGLIDRLPRLVGVQVAGCAPFVRAFERGQDGRSLEPWPAIGTAAVTIAVPNPLDAYPALAAIGASGGTALAVSEEEMFTAQRLLAKEGGILAEPAGAVSLAAVITLRRNGIIGDGQSVVFVVSGSGLKDLPQMAVSLPPPPVFSIEEARSQLMR